LLALNVVALVVGGAVGVLSIRETGQAIEQRLIHAAVRNMADLAAELRLPPTERLVQQLSRIAGADTAAFGGPRGALLASTLPSAAAADLAAAFDGSGTPERVLLHGTAYYVGAAEVVARGAPTAAPPPAFLLVLLMPVDQVRAVQRRAAARIAAITAAAVAGATLLGFWLAAAISRPVRLLADGVARFPTASERTPGPGGQVAPDALRTGEAAGDEAAEPGLMPAPRRAPREIARLWQAFRELEVRLADARRRLARSAHLAAIGQLAASIAHELRNPLSGIKMNARVLADELATRGLQDRSVELIISEVDRMEEYVQELLNLRQIVSGANAAQPGPEPRDEAVRLDEQIDRAVGLLEARCTHMGAEVAVETAADAAVARGDPDRIRQVLMNLLLNALDAVAGRQPARITIRTERASPDAVRCSVSDSGPGMAPEAVDRLFEPFFSTKPNGTGLGLFICQQIVRNHGGRIGCASEESGATFWFELPAGRSHGETEQHPTD